MFVCARWLAHDWAYSHNCNNVWISFKFAVYPSADFVPFIAFHLLPGVTWSTVARCAVADKRCASKGTRWWIRCRANRSLSRSYRAWYSSVGCWVSARKFVLIHARPRNNLSTIFMWYAARDVVQFRLHVSLYLKCWSIPSLRILEFTNLETFRVLRVSRFANL